MELKNRGDLAINGLGSSNGGQFNLVTLNGRGTINNDVECHEFECNGLGTVNGNVTADTARVNGNAKFKGTFESEKLTVEGTAKFEKNLNVKNLRVSGKASVGGSVKCEEIKLRGMLSVGEDCEAELFKGEYRFTIGGLLNADQVEIKIYGECKAKEIGGQTITVRQHKGSFISALLKPIFKAQLETELIEGDKIDLENTIAKVVRGNQVRIGPNCQIGVVEYTDEFSQDKNAIVNDIRKA
ncbi:polymer-forming cytoskeletal protein [Paenibacillus sp. BSR1-1]|uniref:polymer-forming cytoskeletal protein n=1 Tax=Paenibacillus sp. BSR1-1 TaxID=3020845 RepID=UPI0025B0245B|nr:polymer-forming cytoskeletal protein [Paenibacillus sp. BSR1-1]MDN3019437.1 polymer-forming cytoskeletal protein [Paenibacillus sp. BSR1-1]